MAVLVVKWPFRLQSDLHALAAPLPPPVGVGWVWGKTEENHKENKKKQRKTKGKPKENQRKTKENKRKTKEYQGKP